MNAALEPKKRGRPIGTTKDALNEIRLSKVHVNKAIAARAAKIVSAQTVAALGTWYVVELSTDENEKITRTIVRDMKRIEYLLDNAVHGKDYLIVEGTLPDWRAGNAMLDRIHGRAKETLEIEGEVKFSLKQLNGDTKELPPMVKAEVLRIITPGHIEPDEQNKP